MPASPVDPQLLQEFVTEGGELLGELDHLLIELEQQGTAPALLNRIFRGFHTIKGSAAFFDVAPLVALCHVSEDLLDRLRSRGLRLEAGTLELLLAATAAARRMLDALACSRCAAPADPALLAALRGAHERRAAPDTAAPARANASDDRLDWAALYEALTGTAPRANLAGDRRPPGDGRARGRRATDQPGTGNAHAGRRESDGPVSGDGTIRIDTARLDALMALAGEIDRACRRLDRAREQIARDNDAAGARRALDSAADRLDLLVGNLHRAVLSTRMQPVGRLFQRYPRLASDLARQLGKTVELELADADIELDRTIIEALADPLMHLVRNAVDHGIEAPEARRLAGKPAQGRVRLAAYPSGSQVVIEVGDDGRGMCTDVLRRKAVEKGLLDPAAAAALDEQQALDLIFAPGFSTCAEVSSVSGRGVGMDVVRTNVQRLNGTIEVGAGPGTGACISIRLPLTVAIVPVLLVRVGPQPFAIPLSRVLETLPLPSGAARPASGAGTLVLDGASLPVHALSGLLGRPQPRAPRWGVRIACAHGPQVVAVDACIGREHVVVRPTGQSVPHAPAGATLPGDGSVVPVLDLDALLAGPVARPRFPALALAT